MNDFTRDNSPRDSKADETAPPRLVEALRAMNADAPNVPDEIDRRIRGRIRGRFTGLRGRRVLWRRVAPAAAAAGLLLAVVFNRGTGPEPAKSADRAPARLAVLPSDIDGNGSVDVLDAYRVASSLGRGEATREEWDVDGSGVIDDADVDWIMARAVRLDEDAIDEEKDK